jgi:hypothetical protein
MNTNTAVMPVETPPAAKAKKPIYKRWWAIALAAVFALVVISQATGGGDDTGPVADKPTASAPAKAQSAPKPPKAASVPKAASAPKAAAPKAEKPAEKAAEMTAGQENAVESAQNYLSFTAFSRQGLIEQLSSDAGDGYSVKDATFAADHVDANWNEQAAKAAKNYLDMTSFSRKGLIEQLSSDAGDGYTKKQAVYGVDKAGL